MPTAVKWMESAKHLIVVCDDKEPCVILKSDERYQKAMELIQNMDKEGLASFLFLGEAIVKKYEGAVQIEGQKVYLDGELVNNTFTHYIKEFYHNDQDIQPLINFWKNVRENPSQESREQLFLFLRHHKVPLTPDGCFLMYKGVGKGADGNFYDKYTGCIRNNVGDTVRMDRDKVDDRRTVTCSKGLHVATFEYVNSFYGGNVTLECVVNPMNVVSIPNDYNNQKMRVCEYKVVAIGKGPRKELFLPWDIINQIHQTSKEEQTEDIKKKKIGKGKKVNIKGLSAREIVDLVTEKTGEFITFSLKSKRSIQNKALEILRDFGFKVDEV